MLKYLRPQLPTNRAAAASPPIGWRSTAVWKLRIPLRHVKVSMPSRALTGFCE